MLDSIKGKKYQEALQELETGLQTSLDKPETQKVITFLGGIQNIAHEYIFDADQKNANLNEAMVKSMDTINQVVSELLTVKEDGADQKCTKIYTQICSDLRKIAISISESYYINKRDNLKRHFSELANPYLKQKIYNKFQECQSISIDNIITDVLNPLLSLSLPDNIRNDLEGISLEIFPPTSDKFNGNKNYIEKFLVHMKEIIQPEYNIDDLYWGSYRIFLNLSPIFKLSNEDVEKFHELINTKSISPDIFKQEALEILKTNKINIEEIEKEVKITKYKNLNTLLMQIIKQKPVQKEGLATYWNKPEGFFKEKTLYLTDPITFESYNGMITEAKKNQQGDWLFLLDDHSEITITSRYEITVSKNYRYKFLNSILNGTLSKNDVFTLKLSSDQQTKSGMNANSYKISEMGEKKSMLGPLGNDYLEVRLTNLNDVLKYIIYIYKEKIDNQFIPKSVEIKEVKGKKKSFLGTDIMPHIFNGAYTIVKQNHQNILGMNKLNADKNILIKEDKDLNRIRMRHLKEIKEELEGVRSQFLQSKNQELVNGLIDDLVNNQLKKISAQKMKDFENAQPELAMLIQEISKKYNNHLKMERGCEWILRQLIEEVNYALLVDKEKSIVISRTMELLKDACKNLEKIAGKDVIFFIGNTGAGKSAAISYFLGAEMETVTNRVGDKVIQVKETEDTQQHEYPTIGQSLGESETLYAKGYPLQDFPHVLGDCPGFNDTRGGDFEICTNLSIDQAIERAKSIRSIVLIIPIHAFLVDRANPLIELIETVRERFTDAFDPKQIGKNSNFFILITKKNQNEDAVESIRNGSRLQELLNESKKKISDSQETLEGFELERIERRKNIWEALRLMHDQGQIDFIDIEDAFEKDVLLEKYTTADQQQVDKKRYVKAMQGKDMQVKFGKCIEMSAHTWSNCILTPYLITLPKIIMGFNEKLSAEMKKMDEFHQKRKEREEKIVKMKGDEETLESFIQELKKNLEQQSQVGNSNSIVQKINAEIASMSDLKLNELNNDAKKTEEDIENKKNDLAKIELERAHLQRSIGQLIQDIQETKEEIIKLSEGSETTILWESSYKPDDEIKAGYVEGNARNDAHQEGRYLKDEDFRDLLTVKAKDYRGKLKHLAIISRDYRIVSNDPKIRAAFMQQMQKESGYKFHEGNYAAIVEGERFEIDLAAKVFPDSKKISYGFITEWDGNILPSIKISHTIPNVDRNEAAILAKQSDIKGLEEEKIRHEGSLNGIKSIPGKNKERDLCISEIQQLNQKKLDLDIKISEIKKLAFMHSLKEMIKSKQLELDANIKERNIEEDFSNINKNINETAESIKEIQEQIALEQKKKRNFAIIIKGQADTVKQLREFCTLVTEGNTIKEGSDNMAITCLKFQEFYDQRRSEWEAELKKDLNFA
ncbi:MAG: hypothetical protein QRY72_00290 [Candidatus Rhabdochlamydia sp.]